MRAPLQPGPQPNPSYPSPRGTLPIRSPLGSQSAGALPGRPERHPPPSLLADCCPPAPVSSPQLTTCCPPPGECYPPGGIGKVGWTLLAAVKMLATFTDTYMYVHVNNHKANEAQGLLLQCVCLLRESPAPLCSNAAVHWLTLGHSCNLARCTLTGHVVAACTFQLSADLYPMRWVLCAGGYEVELVLRCCGCLALLCCFAAT